MANNRSTSPSRLLLIAILLGATVAAGCAAGPSDIRCTAQSEGNLIEFEPVENATSYNVYRFEEGEEANITNADQIATVNETSYLDTNVTEGAVYRYAVTANMESGGESMPSDICEVTAIPFFPGLAVGALAIMGGLVGYAVFNRQRKQG